MPNKMWDEITYPLPNLNGGCNRWNLGMDKLFHPTHYWVCDYLSMLINTLRPRQNGRHFPDDIFKCIFLNENVWIPNKISLKFVPKGSINNIPALVQIMAWRRPGDKPLSEPMLVSLLTHICVTRPQWVNTFLLDICLHSLSCGDTLQIWMWVNSLRPRRNFQVHFSERKCLNSD